MKVKELRELSETELQKKNADLTQELFNFKFQLHTGRLENTAKLSAIRKDIARVQTVLTEKRG